MLFIIQEEPDVPFTEEDYRRRRSHPNFSKHITLEKVVTKLGKTVSKFFIEMRVYHLVQEFLY